MEFRPVVPCHQEAAERRRDKSNRRLNGSQEHGGATRLSNMQASPMRDCRSSRSSPISASIARFYSGLGAPMSITGIFRRRVDGRCGKYQSHAVHWLSFWIVQTAGRLVIRSLAGGTINALGLLEWLTLEFFAGAGVCHIVLLVLGLLDSTPRRSRSY